jgi:hypothetical protein
MEMPDGSHGTLPGRVARDIFRIFAAAPAAMLLAIVFVLRACACELVLLRVSVYVPIQLWLRFGHGCGSLQYLALNHYPQFLAFAYIYSHDVGLSASPACDGVQTTTRDDDRWMRMWRGTCRTRNGMKQWVEYSLV